MKIIELIEEFKGQIKDRYPGLYIDFDYDSDLDEYDIWHNDSDLEFKDDDFTEFVGRKAQELFYDNEIYNFSFGYDHFKTKELENRTGEYTTKNVKIKSIEITHFNSSDIVNYTDIKIKGTNFELKQKSINLSFNTIESKSPEPYCPKLGSYSTYNNVFNLNDIKEVA